MAGRIIPIIPKTTYEFSAPAAAATLITPIGPRVISSTDWVSGALMVRVFSATFASATATLSVAVLNAFIPPEDPNLLFLGMEGGTTPVSGVPINTNTPVGDAIGALQLDDFFAPIGSMVAVRLAYSQGATAGATTATISVDLVARDA